MAVYSFWKVLLCWANVDLVAFFEVYILSLCNRDGQARRRQEVQEAEGQNGSGCLLWLWRVCSAMRQGRSPVDEDGPSAGPYIGGKGLVAESQNQWPRLSRSSRSRDPEANRLVFKNIRNCPMKIYWIPRAIPSENVGNIQMNIPDIFAKYQNQRCARSASSNYPLGIETSAIGCSPAIQYYTYHARHNTETALATRVATLTLWVTTELYYPPLPYGLASLVSPFPWTTHFDPKKGRLRLTKGLLFELTY